MYQNEFASRQRTGTGTHGQKAQRRPVTTHSRGTETHTAAQAQTDKVNAKTQTGFRHNKNPNYVKELLNEKEDKAKHDPMSRARARKAAGQQHSTLEPRPFTTPQHKSSKAGSNNTQHTCNRTPESIKLLGMDTGKFLHTNMNAYLKKNMADQCISCQNCMKKSDKMLQYKYNQQTKSAYTANFKKSHNVTKQKQFNLDDERRALAVPYNPPKTFQTSYGNQFMDTANSPDKQVKPCSNSFKTSGVMGKLNPDDENPFVNSSSYAMMFPDYGSLPKANMRDRQAVRPRDVPLEKVSSYKRNFVGVGQEEYVANKNEKKKVLEYKNKQIRGNLASDDVLPFNGVSTAKSQYGRSKKIEVVEKFLPYDMLCVPHSLHMAVKSENHKEYGAKMTKTCTNPERNPTK